MADSITPGEQRIELQLEGLRSVCSAGFLVMADSQRRVEALLERIAKALEADVRPHKATAQGLVPVR